VVDRLGAAEFATAFMGASQDTPAARSVAMIEVRERFDAVLIVHTFARSWTGSKELGEEPSVRIIANASENEGHS
jgi:hypothetical protein